MQGTPRGWGGTVIPMGGSSVFQAGRSTWLNSFASWLPFWLPNTQTKGIHSNRPTGKPSGSASSWGWRKRCPTGCGPAPSAPWTSWADVGTCDQCAKRDRQAMTTTPILGMNRIRGFPNNGKHERWFYRVIPTHSRLRTSKHKPWHTRRSFMNGWCNHGATPSAETPFLFLLLGGARVFGEGFGPGVLREGDVDFAFVKPKRLAELHQDRAALGANARSVPSAKVGRPSAGNWRRNLRHTCSPVASLQFAISGSCLAVNGRIRTALLSCRNGQQPSVA